jgi:hypothetical protein
MTRIIWVQDNDYERQYQESMCYLDNRYHNYPTMLRPIPALENGDYNYDVRSGEQRRERPERMKVR